MDQPFVQTAVIGALLMIGIAGLIIRHNRRKQRRRRSLRRDDDGSFVWIELDGSCARSRHDPTPRWDAEDSGDADGGGDGGGGD